MTLHSIRILPCQHLSETFFVLIKLKCNDLLEKKKEVKICNQLLIYDKADLHWNFPLDIALQKIVFFPP